MVYDSNTIIPILKRLCALEKKVGTGALGNTYFYGNGEPDITFGAKGDVYTDLNNAFYYSHDGDRWINDGHLIIDPIDGGTF